MNKLICLIAVLALGVTACKPERTKYMVNDKSEVYYEGDSVTIEDARRLGDYLLKNNYFDTANRKTVHLTKSAGLYEVTFAVNEEAVKKDPGAETLFSIMGTGISTYVFNMQPVKVILADEEMNDFRELPLVTGSTDTEEIPSSGSTVDSLH